MVSLGEVLGVAGRRGLWTAPGLACAPVLCFFLVLGPSSLVAGFSTGLGSDRPGDISLKSTTLVVEVGSWDVATDNQGQMVTVYSHGSEIYFARISSQLQVHSPVRVCSSDDQVTSISIMQDSDQAYRLAYATYRLIRAPEACLNIFTSFSIDGGRTWSAPRLALGGNRTSEGQNMYFDLCLAEDAHGVFWMFWNFAARYKDGLSGKFTTSIDRGVTWSPAQTMFHMEGDTPIPARFEGLTTDSCRQLHLIYTSDIFDSRGDIWYQVRLAQSQNWSQAERIVPYIEVTSATVYSQSTNQAWEDRLWVLWHDVGYKSERYVLGYSDNSGEAWQTYGYIDRDIIGSYHVLERPRPKLASMETDSSQETGLYIFWQEQDSVQSSPIGKVIEGSEEIPETALTTIVFLLLLAASLTICRERFQPSPR